jgi:hypothetical protein
MNRRATDGAAIAGDTPMTERDDRDGALAAIDPDARLQRSRQIDWRFLLPDPTPGRVAIVGPADAGLVAALIDAGWSVVDGPNADADLAVVVRPGGRALEDAARSVRPGGAVYVICVGPFGGAWRRPRPLDPSEVDRRLRGLGFADIRRQVHIRDHLRRSAIVPLDDPAALRMLLRRRGGLLGRTPVVRGAEFLRRTGWLARLAAGASVVATRPGSEVATDAVRAFVGRDGPAPLLLTPGFRASRHVVALLSSDGGGSVGLVVKVARSAGGDPGGSREAAILAELATAPAIVRDGSPRLVTQAEPWGLQALVETGLSGVPLGPKAVRRDPDAAVTRVLPWLAALARDRGSPASWPSAADRLDRLAERPLAAFEAAVTLDAGERALVDATRASIATLRSVSLPDVIEHGDVSHPNLLVTPSGGLAVVDWELGELHGLPGHDLAGFVAYVAVASAAARTPEAQGSAIARAIAEPGGWLHATSGVYAADIGLDPGLMPDLAVVAWMRQVVGMVERLHDGQIRPVAPATVEWLRGHRAMAAWAAAVARRDRTQSGPER